MKVLPCACLLGLAILSPLNAVTLSALTSPVTRVVKLLQGLSEKVEEEGKKEKDLYETYVCWGKSVVEQKEASNSAAESRIGELDTYIADLDAGRITLTSEQADLNKEIEELTSDVETATAMRNKEHHDFLVAEDEMKKGIQALDSAIGVLDTATKDHKGMLLGVRQSLNGEERLNGGLEAFAWKQANLMRAVELGQRSLSKADSLFLQRALLGEAPSPDWKKLNRKATFKMSYKARSGKIQELLQKMKTTFEENLKEAQEKEADAKEKFDKLSTAKNGQLDAARTALTEMNVEGGARGVSKQDASDEVEALKSQVENDKKVITDTEAALATKEKEYKEREALRNSELEAISQAIGILHSDDARDMFKKSLASQGSFLQIRRMSEQKAVIDAGATLRDAARRSGDTRLLILASGLNPTAKERLKPVIEAIDKMIAMLQKEETEDLEIKQTCESDRMSETRNSITAAREIDDLTDKAVKLDSDIKKLDEDIKGLQEEQVKVEDQLKAAKRIRDDDHADWSVTDKDDADAAALVKQAKDLLAKFYSENKALLQKGNRAPIVEAGEAPPPPPATWEGGYKVKETESKGIMTMLDLIHEDILKDQAAAKTEEDAAQKEYDEFKKTSEDNLKSLKDQEEEKESVKGTTIQDKTDTEESRGTKKEALDGSLDIVKANNPKCEYFEVNYVLRVKNRQIEVDGLQKAKAILEGGSFSSAANLLQSRRK